DLKRLKASVRASFAADPKGEGLENPIYPNPLKETYDERRRKCGEDMYAAIGIGLDNKQGRLLQFVRNYDFFGAPVGMIL
ncbi:nitroreductase, partial [Escherichia coli]|nr:nitroreductase [Escherichia coli]